MTDETTVHESVSESEEATQARRGWLALALLAGAAIVIVFLLRRRRRARLAAYLGDRVYRTSTDPSKATTLTFGEGISGARPPSGHAMATTGNRSGDGAAGNVDHGASNYLVFLGTWDRAVTAAEDPVLFDVALGGADTSPRRPCHR